MNAFAAYLVGTILIALLGLMSALNFARYRFKGDKTFLIITLIGAAFVATILFTIFQFVPDVDPVRQGTFF